MLQIRAAAEKDLETLLALVRRRREETGDTYYLDTNVIEAMLLKTVPGTVLLAFSDAVPVGYCAFTVCGSVRRARTELYLDDIYVVPEYRKQYFGKLLLNTAVRIASDYLCMAVEWVCDTTDGQSFFAHCGAPAPVDGRYHVEVTGIPHLGEFVPSCGGHHTPNI